MNFKNSLILSFVMVFSICFDSNSQNEIPRLQGPYLGQKVPGSVAEIFAPGIVSVNGRYDYAISFSPKLDEMYFTANKKGDTADVYFTNSVNGLWQPIQKLSLTQGEKAGEMEPFVSSDGKKVYFTAYNTDYSDTKIWAVDRTDTGWGKASKLKSPINDEEVFNSTLAKNGDLYFTDIFKSQTYYAPNENGEYPQIHKVDIEFGVHAFISPNQDYLLVDSVVKGEGARKDRDIFVYFRKGDGSWSQPYNLGEAVNTEYMETVPSVSPDGKYLFFGRYNEEGGLSNIYWVSTDVIEKLRPAS